MRSVTSKINVPIMLTLLSFNSTFCKKGNLLSPVTQGMVSWSLSNAKWFLFQPLLAVHVHCLNYFIAVVDKSFLWQFNECNLLFLYSCLVLFLEPEILSPLADGFKARSGSLMLCTGCYVDSCNFPPINGTTGLDYCLFMRRIYA